ncbi:uncharacterized protein LOC117294015 [Asterias rubens]|uniref:uncharacterized protein LOC117294015 n=1 Tax=Asterias rubens TaxID=7604 RepID=UPI0014554FC5|nr:uncharacterized protein LOC117294015 [Asterias rubens]
MVITFTKEFGNCQKKDYTVIQIKDRHQRIKMILRPLPQQSSNKLHIKGHGKRQAIKRKTRPSDDGEVLAQTTKRPRGTPIARYSDQRIPSNFWLNELRLNARDVEILDNGEWLTDDHISAAQTLLRRQFPAMSGLQEPALGEILQFQHMNSDGVQVMLNGGGHWVTISQMNGTVKLLDSENVGLSPKLSSQIMNLFSGSECELQSPTGLEIQLPKMHPQRGSSDCGVFALAYATEIAFGGHPESTVFDQRSMRGHFKRCLSSLQMVPFPKLKCTPRSAKDIGGKSETI